mmetsp:Transcript_25468/g.100568  ORF Transcript_25468/g.100568 Transcript_25468/m.100568 type:complete len:152 (+) Transcript_25468:2470-2925(+)
MWRAHEGLHVKIPFHGMENPSLNTASTQKQRVAADELNGFSLEALLIDVLRGLRSCCLSSLQSCNLRVEYVPANDFSHDTTGQLPQAYTAVSVNIFHFRVLNGQVGSKPVQIADYSFLSISTSFSYLSDTHLPHEHANLSSIKKTTITKQS